jgi:hypothetical protein
LLLANWQFALQINVADALTKKRGEDGDERAEDGSGNAEDRASETDAGR